MLHQSPTGDPQNTCYCLMCGKPGGHGNLPCPNSAPFDPLPQGGSVPLFDSQKLDRIIELLEQLLARETP